MATTQEPAYAAVVLPDLLSGVPDLRSVAIDKQNLLLPLTIAYLVSAHVSVRLPMREQVVPLVDRVFDEILRGKTLEVKGVLYVPVAGAAQARDLVAGAALVITSDAALTQIAACVPRAIISTANGRPASLELCNLAVIADQKLRETLDGCAQLINLQGEGFCTEGDFSVSW